MPHAVAMPKGNVFSGARARFSIDTKIVGFATNCTGSEEIQYEPVQVLDHIQTVEFVAVGYTVTFSASRVRLIGNAADIHGSLRGPMNAFPKLGQHDGDFLLNILNLADLQCQIEDTVSGKIFMQLEQVKVASHNWAITPRGIVGEDINFVAVRMKDEAEA
jgi:hypothetical protein